ncbi:MAG: 1-deoxy-D-xylulose-5-phosphate reductoisomerase [Alloprevotella sp.]|nr:1-deoxy-D-xylulose-5-phosphate reductoisomerase [Alloprevotella sp.]
MSTKIAILGSTGSIGTQTLDIVRQHPDKLEVYVLTAGNNADLLIRQAIEFQPDSVVIANEAFYEKVREALSTYPIKIFAGATALADIVENENIDVVVSALVGFAGLAPIIRAIKASKRIALANKESLVVAGELITRLVPEYRSVLLPLDSEHSAIFQCLMSNRHCDVSKLILTASGGPFRNYSLEALSRVLPQQALAHPTWNMGAKITIDSATMMNKGFEMIEARWLFDISPDNIEIVVHPESIIHSAVEYCDGVIIAQMGSHDMRMPIQYALSFPNRWNLEAPRLDFSILKQLTFDKPDFQKFPCLSIAYDVIAQGGNKPCVMNAANEVANLAFRQEQISFTRIPEIIEQTLSRVPFQKCNDLSDYISADHEARSIAQSLL